MLIHILIIQRYGWHGADDAVLQENFNEALGLFPWLDKYRDRSVTELEFLHGHLNNPGNLPTYICFRDKVTNNILFLFLMFLVVLVLPWDEISQ